VEPAWLPLVARLGHRRDVAVNSAEIRALQALRAPGGIDVTQAGERWPNAGTRDLYALVRRGFAEKIDDTFFITEAGRAACPCRNPLAVTPATPPEVFTMPKGETQVTRQQVLDAIVAAGSSGISRKELIKKFEYVDSIIDNHVMLLNRAKPPVIYKPRPGLLIDIRFKSAGAESKHDQETAIAPASTATVEPCVQQTAKSETQAALTATGDTQSKAEGTPQIAYDWVKGPAPHDIHGTSLDVHHHDAADLPPASLAQQMAQIGGFIPTIVEDINVADPKDVEFAIYSSGCMDMHFTDLSVTLQPPVLAKLRGFLGLFQEAV